MKAGGNFWSATGSVVPRGLVSIEISTLHEPTESSGRFSLGELSPQTSAAVAAAKISTEGCSSLGVLSSQHAQTVGAESVTCGITAPLAMSTRSRIQQSNQSSTMRPVIQNEVIIRIKNKNKKREGGTKKERHNDPQQPQIHSILI